MPIRLAARFIVPARMPGDESDAMRKIAVRGWNAQRRRNRRAGRDATHDFDCDACPRQAVNFLPAAAEHIRIAAFNACDHFALVRQRHHQAVDERLRRRLAAAAFADFDDTRVAPHKLQDVTIDQIIEQYHVGEPERAHRAQRQQLDVTGSGAYKKYFAAAHAVWLGRGTQLLLVQKLEHASAQVVIPGVVDERETLARARQLDLDNVADRRRRAVGHHDDAVGQ